MEAIFARLPASGRLSIPAHAAGLLLPATRAAGLSIGDSVCLALERRLGVP
jgi:PIN domain nuclease of toxin-antitoxin system